MFHGRNTWDYEAQWEWDIQGYIINIGCYLPFAATETAEI